MVYYTILVTMVLSSEKKIFIVFFFICLISRDFLKDIWKIKEKTYSVYAYIAVCLHQCKAFTPTD